MGHLSGIPENSSYMVEVACTMTQGVEKFPSHMVRSAAHIRHVAFLTVYTFLSRYDSRLFNAGGMEFTCAHKYCTYYFLRSVIILATNSLSKRII